MKIELSRCSHAHYGQAHRLHTAAYAPFVSLVQRVSEAQSAVVNDSPVDCQSRRPGRPQAVARRAGGIENMKEGKL